MTVDNLHKISKELLYIHAVRKSIVHTKPDFDFFLIVEHCSNTCLIISVVCFGMWVKYFFFNICKICKSHADALHHNGIWLKILNIQLSSNLCQYIWKHTNRMPDKGLGCHIRMSDTGCRTYGNSP